MNKDIRHFMQKAFITFFSFFALFMSTASHALVFSIIPKGGTTLPTSVNAASTVTAYYTVYNLTASQRNGNFVKYLPPNVTQVTSGGTYGDTCGSSFSLAPYGQIGYSCTLQLTISGVVSSSDPSPSNHLFLCFPGGKTCAGTNYPLHVTESSEKTLTSIAVTPTSVTIGIAGTQQYTATGTYSDSSMADITSTASWLSSVPGYASISSTGLATGVAAGTTDISASLNAITSNTATLTVDVPVTVALTTPTANATNVSVSTPIVITLSGAVQPATVTTSTFEVGTTPGGSDIAGNIVMSGGDTIATYTPTTNLPFNTTIYVTVTSDILATSGNSIAANNFTFTSLAGYLVYLSSITTSGSMGGVNGADTICQSDSQCPVGSTCQAIIVSNGTPVREASPTPTNWVLQPSAPYYNTNGLLIGITTSDAVFNFPITNSIGSGNACWTGLNADWTTFISLCFDWTSNNFANVSMSGVSNNIDAGTISANLSACNTAFYLYCAQQP